MCTIQILLDNRPGWEVSQPNPFQFKSDRVTATFKETSHVNGDWRAYFTGASEVQFMLVQLTNLEMWPYARESGEYLLAIVYHTAAYCCTYFCPTGAVQSCAI